MDLAYAESQVVSAPTVPVETAPAGTDPAPPASALRVAMLPQGHLRAAPEGVGADGGPHPLRRRQGRASGSSTSRRRGGCLTPPTRRTPRTCWPTPTGDNRDGIAGFVGDHGTAVLGIVAATGPGVRVAGVAPRLAEAHCSSHYDATTTRSCTPSTPSRRPSVDLQDGDVLLLEVQRPGENNSGLLPTEIDPADFEAISDATGAGIVVVEAAANGTRDLDLWRHPADGRCGPCGAAVRATRSAIVVGSCVAAVIQRGTPASPTPTGATGWTATRGVKSVATAYATATAGEYTTTFNGTSAASAIVAGSRWRPRACSARRTRGATLDPAAMRGVAVGARQHPAAAGERHRAGSAACRTSPSSPTQIGAADCADDDETVTTAGDGDG